MMLAIAVDTTVCSNAATAIAIKSAIVIKPRRERAKAIKAEGLMGFAVELIRYRSFSTWTECLDAGHANILGDGNRVGWS